MYIKWNKRGVRVCFALIGGLCVSVPLIRCNSVIAAASDLESYTLSPEQALALYGTTLQGEYYTGSTVKTVSLQYIGNTSALSKTMDFDPGMSDYVGYSYFPTWNMNDFTNGWLSRTLAWETPWLIYKWDIDQISSAPNFDFSLRLNFSVDISAFGFGQAVLWSRSTNSVYPGVNAGLSQYASSFTLYGDTVQSVVARGGYLSRPGVDSEYGMCRTYVLPCQYLNTTDLTYFHGNEIMNTFLGMCAFAGSRQTGGESVTINNEVVQIKLERPVQQPQRVMVTTDSGGNTSVAFYEYSDPAVYILIQCPVLYGDYILPPGNAGNSVDLSIIEGYLADSNDSLLNISEESTVQTRQLIAILAKLEQIYQKIPSVDLSVPTLSTAPSIPIDSELDSRISADLESGAELLPDISESFDTEKMQSFSDLLTRARNWFPAEIITIGGLSLALAFVTWLLFRGRGS